MKHFRLPLFALGALLLVALAGCTPSDTRQLLDRSEALGAVLAEETARLAGPNKKVAVILPHWGTASTLGESLQKSLKKRGVTVAFSIPADVGNPMHRVALGLKSADFLAAMEKAAGLGAVVSLAGTPLVEPQDASKLSPDHPPVIVVATASLGNVMGLPGDRGHLASLLDAKIVRLAFIDGPDPDAPPSGKADAIHQAFALNYRVIRALQ